MEKIFVPHLIYRNVLVMMRDYRHLDMVSPEIPEDKFRKDIQFDGVVTVEAVDGEGHRPRQKITTYLAIMGINSKYTESTAGFKRYIDQITRQRGGKMKKENLEVIIISPEELSTHIKKKIADISSEKLRILKYTYNVFKTEIPKHRLNDPHELMTGEEVEKTMENLASEPHKHGKLRAHKDPTAIWYGFEPGDLVRVRAVSENSGKKILYRYVV